MPSIKSFAVALTAALALYVPVALVTGCGSQPGQTVFTQGRGSGDPVMGEAPKDGTYKLYTAMSPNPTMTVKLREGDPLGFRKTDDGKIEAVAGEQSTTLGGATAQAYWKLQK